MEVVMDFKEQIIYVLTQSDLLKKKMAEERHLFLEKIKSEQEAFYRRQELKYKAKEIGLHLVDPIHSETASGTLPVKASRGDDDSGL
jgi:hypothetical protein